VLYIRSPQHIERQDISYLSVFITLIRSDFNSSDRLPILGITLRNSKASNIIYTFINSHIALILRLINAKAQLRKTTAA
jgi:hypothetical protein